MNSTVKTLFLWMAIFGVVILLWNTFQGGKAAQKELTFSEFTTAVKAGEVSEVTIRGKQLSGKFSDRSGAGDSRYQGGQEFKTQLPDYPDLVKDLQASNVKIKAEEPRDNPLVAVLLTWAPVLLIVGLWIFFMRQMQTGGNRALSFGKSKAKLLNTSGKKVTFKEVAGVEEAKEELQEIVEFLKEPQKFQKLGGRIPKGVLLMGPPGTGKTLLARAIAGEANVPFFSISGSDFVEMFVGVGASRVRDLFEQGKKNAPCIIFIDEIDAVGRHRGAGLGGGHDEREQTLNQLLVEMDGFESNEGVILIAATNRPDVLDPALLRPGRFDRRVVVDRPDINGRLGILKVHTRNIPLDEKVQLGVIARGTPGFAGADLANLVNEAALIAARRNKKKVEMDDFEFAKDKVIMGVERKTMMLTEDERSITAYHEAGHALVAAFTPGADPLHKVTIIPRGRALGLTMQLPTEDKYTYKKMYVEAQIAILMGGRVAEELTQEDITTGAGNDIERATEMARRMVCEWGMSELGPLAYGTKDEPVFLGREFAQRADYSEDTANRIDHEVTRIVQTGYEAARAILTRYREVLDRVARDLLERESLDGEEVYNTIRAMTGQDHAPTRPVPPGEGLVVGGHEVPESVVTAARAGAVGAPPAEVPGATDVSNEVEAEVAGPKRRAAQPQPPVPEPEQSR
ncbi:MAG: cell division protease FtsH [Acidobacteriota bacterium]|nr:cell division protease FtsH [Acidobacteriota bacterium]